jgi:hypothetical protein
MTTDNMLQERKKYGISPELKMTKKEEEVILEWSKYNRTLNEQKKAGEHVVLVKCSPETYKMLKTYTDYNIYPNRKRGYEGTYLVDLQHNIVHK